MSNFSFCHKAFSHFLLNYFSFINRTFPILFRCFFKVACLLQTKASVPKYMTFTYNKYELRNNFTLSPHIDTFYRLCNKRFLKTLKTLRQKEKLHTVSNFSFCHKAFTHLILNVSSVINRKFPILFRCFFKVAYLLQTKATAPKYMTFTYNKYELRNNFTLSPYKDT